MHAFAQGLPSQHEPMTNYYCEDPLQGPAWTCATKLWSQSELGPEDIDVAQIYDAFTPLVLLLARGLRFLREGRGGRPSSRDGGLRWDRGRLPVNTSGGSLSEAYVHGFNLVTEGVKQLRGTSTSQVAGRPGLPRDLRGMRTDECGGPARATEPASGRRGPPSSCHVKCGDRRRSDRRRERNMVGDIEIRTDREACMGSGNCHFLAEESFDLGEDGRVVVLETATFDEERLRRAADGCPVGAISLWRNGQRIEV